MSEVSAAYRKSGWSSCEIQNRMVKQVDELCSKLQSLRFGKQEILVDTHICLRESRSTQTPDAASPERVRRWQAERAWVPPLEEVGSRSASRVFDVLRTTTARGALAVKQWTGSAGSGRILKPD